jgi:cbb3-type cytochrome oxidase maturation protein
VTNLLYLIPLALFLGGLGLAAFVWSLRSGQYDDLDGAAHRILFDDEDADTATPTSSPRWRAADPRPVATTTASAPPHG